LSSLVVRNTGEGHTQPSPHFRFFASRFRHSLKDSSLALTQFIVIDCTRAAALPNSTVVIAKGGIK
jgi:hypothetical protein